jgi:hypothetical protein
MNKKGIIFMTFVGIAFITAIVLFFYSSPSYLSGGETDYIGEKEILLFETYQEAEEDIYYIELAARLSLKNIEVSEFDESFKEYLVKGNFVTESGILSIEDYQITLSESEAIGITTEKLIYSGVDYTYKITPNFKVVIGETEAEVQSFVEEI